MSRLEYIFLFGLMAVGASAVLYEPTRDNPVQRQLPKFELCVDGVALGLHDEQIRNMLGEPDFPQWPSLKMPVHCWNYGPTCIRFFDRESRSIGVTGKTLLAEGNEICAVGDNRTSAVEAAEKLGKATVDWESGKLTVVIVAARPGCVTLTFQSEKLESIELEHWGEGNVRNERYRPKADE